MDVSFSAIGYYYNPIPEEKIIRQTALNALVDGTIDIAETGLFSNQQQNDISVPRTYTTKPKIRGLTL